LDGILGKCLANPDAALVTLREITPQFYTATSRDGWARACQSMSLLGGGQWWPKETGLTWCMGRRHIWVVEPSQVPGILAARAIVTALGLECGYSIGSAARALLRFVGPAQYHYKSSLALTAETGDAYIECHPGQYLNSCLYDCKSYYYSLLRRLPTWRVTVRSSGGLRLHGTFSGEDDRRVVVLDRVCSHKLLRNALIGCMVGRQTGSPYYHKGDRKLHRGGPGLFRGAGLLIRRTAWELTRRASVQTDSKLSNTDCVLSQDGLYPEEWDRYGLVVEQRLEGDAEVCAPTIYRVGSHLTVWYGKGSRFMDAQPRPALPSREYVDEWLRVA
jgi:hypothetical protein